VQVKSTLIHKKNPKTTKPGDQTRGILPLYSGGGRSLETVISYERRTSRKAGGLCPVVATLLHLFRGNGKKERDRLLQWEIESYQKQGKYER